MQISTQQIVNAVASMSENLSPREKTLQFIRDFAFNYKVSQGQGLSLV